MKGTFKAIAKAFERETQAKKYVTEGSNGATLGQDTAEKLNIMRVGPPEDSKHLSINDINQGKTVERTIHPKIQQVLDNNTEIFQGMGKLKDYQLQLHINKNVTQAQL